jgi:hypothetical protein
MKQKIDDSFENDEMLSEYDFSGDVRGKYHEAYQHLKNAVILDPDVAEVFYNSVSVNNALRLFIQISKSLQV